MPIEEVVPIWNILPLKNDFNRKEILALLIQELERRPNNIEATMERLKETRKKNKEIFDKKY